MILEKKRYGNIIYNQHVEHINAEEQLVKKSKDNLQL